MTQKIFSLALILGLSMNAAATVNCEQTRAQSWKNFQSEKLSLPLPRLQKIFSNLSAEDYEEFKKRHFAPLNTEIFQVCMEKCQSTGDSSASGNGLSCKEGCEQMAFIENVHAASEFLSEKTGVALQTENIEEGQILEFITDFSNPDKLLFGFDTTLRTPKGMDWYQTPYESRKKIVFAVLGSPEQKELQVEVCTSDLTYTSLCSKYTPVAEFMEALMPAECPKLKREDAKAFYRVNW